MPRSKEDFKEVSQKRESTILETSLRLFALQGYSAVSIDDITKASKCSHGLFYHYFSSKQDLFDKLMNKVIKQWEDDYSVIDFEQNPVFAIRDISRFLISYLSGKDSNAYILYMFLTFRLQKNIPIPKEKTKSKRQGPFAKLFEIVKRGQEQDLFLQGEPLDYIRVYLACLQGLSYTRIHLGIKKFKPLNPDILANIFLKKNKGGKYV